MDELNFPERASLDVQTLVLAQTVVPSKAVTHRPLLGTGAINRQSGRTLTGAIWPILESHM